MKSIRFVVAIASVMVSMGAALAAQSAKDDFPNRPLRYIVAFAPGGASDIYARIVADALVHTMGKQVVIDNRAGAAGTIGAEVAAQATPDGYTIFACNIASLAVSPALYKKLNYDPAAFQPIDLIGSNPNVLSVHPSMPTKTVAQFIEYAKARPGKVIYGSAGVGTSPQLSMELFRMNAGLQLVHVPYRGGGPQLTGLLSGEVQTMFSTVPLVLGSVRAGKVRPLGVSSATRSPDLPDVPTIQESGMPGFEIISWQGVCTPPGVPKARLGQLRKFVAAALAMPDTRKRLADQGVQLTPVGPEKFGAFIRAERAKWAKLVKDVGIEPQ